MKTIKILIFSYIFLLNRIKSDLFNNKKVINTCGYLETTQPKNANECKEEGEICCYVEVTDPSNNNEKLRFCVSSPFHLVKSDIKQEVKDYTGYILDDLVCNNCKYILNNFIPIVIFLVFILF